MNMKFKRDFFRSISMSLIVLVIISCVSSGCEPLRKKFVRQKKKEDTKREFIPVLDPIDYPARLHSTDEKYRHHYSLWQVWSKDLLGSLDSEGDSPKRQKYLLDQMSVQAQEMMNYVTGEKKQIWESLLTELINLRDNLDTLLFRSKSSVKNRARVVTSRVLRELNPKLESVRVAYVPVTE